MVRTSTDLHSLQILGVDLLKVCITSIPCILCVLSIPCIPCISCIPYILCIPCIPCIFCIPCIPGIPFIPCIPWNSPLPCILYPLSSLSPLLYFIPHVCIRLVFLNGQIWRSILTTYGHIWRFQLLSPKSERWCSFNGHSAVAWEEANKQVLRNFFSRARTFFSGIGPCGYGRIRMPWWQKHTHVLVESVMCMTGIQMEHFVPIFQLVKISSVPLHQVCNIF